MAHKEPKINGFLSLLKNILGLIPPAWAAFRVGAEIYNQFLKRNSLVASNTPTWISSVIEWLRNHDQWLIIVVLLFFVIVLLQRLAIAKKNVLNEIGLFTDELHRSFVHKLRDHTHRLSNIEKEIRSLDISSPTGRDQYKIRLEDEFQTLTKNVEPFLSIVSDYLSKMRKADISACVKIFSIGSNDLGGSVDNNNIVTLARCKNTAKIRKQAKNNPVVQLQRNTDFRDLSLGFKDFFGSSDLVALASNGGYESDSPNYQSNSYKSTLVVPIRYVSVELSGASANKSYNVIGFLCVDSKKTIRQWEEKESFDLDLLSFFGDLLYIYLQRFRESFQIGN